MSHMSSTHLGQKIYKNSDEDYRTLNYRTKLCTEWVNCSRPIASPSKIEPKSDMMPMQVVSNHQAAMVANRNQFADSFFDETTPIKKVLSPAQDFFLHRGPQRYGSDRFRPNVQQLGLRLHPQRNANVEQIEMAPNHVNDRDEKKVKHELQRKSRFFFGREKIVDDQNTQQLPSTFNNHATDDLILNAEKWDHKQMVPRDYRAERSHSKPNIDRIRVHKSTHTVTRLKRRQIDCHRPLIQRAHNLYRGYDEPLRQDHKDISTVYVKEDHKIHPLDQPTKRKRYSNDSPQYHQNYEVNRNMLLQRTIGEYSGEKGANSCSNQLDRIENKNNYYQNGDNDKKLVRYETVGDHCEHHRRQENQRIVISPPNGSCVIKIEVQCLCKSSDY